MSGPSGSYVFKVLIAFDVLASVCMFRDPDVTISSECGLALRSSGGNGILRGLGHVLNFISTNHCENAIANDIARAQTAQKYLGG